MEANNNNNNKEKQIMWIQNYTACILKLVQTSEDKNRLRGFWNSAVNDCRGFYVALCSK